MSFFQLYSASCVTSPCAQACARSFTPFLSSFLSGRRGALASSVIKLDTPESSPTLYRAPTNEFNGRCRRCGLSAIISVNTGEPVLEVGSRIGVRHRWLSMMNCGRHQQAAAAEGSGHHITPPFIDRCPVSCAVITAVLPGGGCGSPSPSTGVGRT